MKRTLRLTPEDSGLTITAYQGEEPVLIGGVALASLQWSAAGKPFPAGVRVASVAHLPLRSWDWMLADGRLLCFGGVSGRGTAVGDVATITLTRRTIKGGDGHWTHPPLRLGEPSEMIVRGELFKSSHALIGSAASAGAVELCRQASPPHSVRVTGRA